MYVRLLGFGSGGKICCCSNLTLQSPIFNTKRPSLKIFTSCLEKISYFSSWNIDDCGRTDLRLNSIHDTKWLDLNMECFGTTWLDNARRTGFLKI